MRLGMSLGVMGLCLLSTGCRLAWDISHNLAFETCLCVDTVKSKIYYCHLANEAWKQYRGGHPEQAGCKAFGRGFRAGYADYLEGGGPVNCAPPLPPQRFWKCRYQNPEGRAATEAWFAGFKEGTAAAKISGYRNYIIVPVSKCDPPHPASPAPGMTPPPPTAVPTTPVLPPASSGPAVPPTQELPTPRPLSPAPPAGGSLPEPRSLQGPEVRREQENPGQALSLPSSALPRAESPLAGGSADSGSAARAQPISSLPKPPSAAELGTITFPAPVGGPPALAPQAGPGVVGSTPPPSPAVPLSGQGGQIRKEMARPSLPLNPSASVGPGAGPAPAVGNGDSATGAMPPAPGLPTQLPAVSDATSLLSPWIGPSSVAFPLAAAGQPGTAPKQASP